MQIGTYLIINIKYKQLKILNSRTNYVQRIVIIAKINMNIYYYFIQNSNNLSIIYKSYCISTLALIFN